jgi:hypothetical protein
MTRTHATLAVVLAGSLCVLGTAYGQAQTASGGRTLGSVRVSRAVTADGKPLAAGTYEVRLTDEEPAAVAGESPKSERWIEFRRSGSVAGREVAIVIPDGEMHQIAKSPKPPANGSRVDLLKGGDYLRIWINRGGTNYLINLRARP